MPLKTLHDIDVKGKQVFYRAPYDVGFNQEGKLKSDLRFKATLPSLKYLLKQDCSIVIATYVKRPEGKVVEKWRTGPHAKRLSELLGVEVKKVDGYAIETRWDTPIQMLENTRFDKREYEDDDGFARELLNGSEIVVFDAWPEAHRKHASTTGVLREVQEKVVGFYFEKEMKGLSYLLEKAGRELVIVLGGAKMDKLDYVEGLEKIADKVILAGKLADKNVGLDIDHKEQMKLIEEIGKAKSIFWNGVVGKVEEGYFKGSRAILEACLAIQGVKVVAGGDTTSFVDAEGKLKGFDHVSLGGGSTLEFLIGKELAVLKYL